PSDHCLLSGKHLRGLGTQLVSVFGGQDGADPLGLPYKHLGGRSDEDLRAGLFKLVSRLEDCTRLSSGPYESNDVAPYDPKRLVKLQFPSRLRLSSSATP
ncbi:MAG TPA: hypothetical protein VE288_17360, partial [Rubrobacteraceae bacterium]|nr:hypothetical protein [Rubrobacteraceae bacterium]